MGRIVVILVALLVADGYFLQGRYTRATIETAEGFAADFNYQVAHFLRQLDR